MSGPADSEIKHLSTDYLKPDKEGIVVADKFVRIEVSQFCLCVYRLCRERSVTFAQRSIGPSSSQKPGRVRPRALATGKLWRGKSPRSFYVALGILLLVSLTCNLPTADQTGEDTPVPDTAEVADTEPRSTPTHLPSATPVPDYFDLEGNPVYYKPPPREAVELMIQQVETGDTDLEDGVLELLRLMANEGPLPAYAGEGEGELVFDSGWGLSLMAYEVYQDSDNPVLRAELERLLRKLAPPREALDLYAVPAESYTGGSVAGLQVIANSQISCSEVWAAGFPETEGPVPQCLLYDWFIVDGYEFRVYYPTELIEDAAAMARVAAALEALKDSQKVYRELVEVRSINVVFSLVGAVVVGGPKSGVAMIPAFEPGELGSIPCPITVFNAAKDVPLPNFKQIMAHEVFHCIHLWRKGVSGYTDMKWYNEGMANYFSNVVYPLVNHEFNFVAEFHADSITSSIFEMTYSNTVLFQYLGNRYGDPWLIELLDGMPSDQSAMLSYMANQPDMEKVFHDFAQAYMESSIADTGGGFLPGKPLFWPGKSVQYPGAESLQLEAKPFHIERARLEFADQMKFQLDLNLNGDPASESAKLPSGGWESLPSTIVVCGDPSRYVVVLTITAPGAVASTAATFEIGLADSEEHQCDPCLIGEWVRDLAEDDYWDAVIIETADQETQLESVEGLQRLIFNENGLYESHTEDFILVWLGPVVAGPLGDQSTRVVTTSQRSAFGVYSTIELSSLVMVEEAYELYSKTEVQASGPISGLGGEEHSESGESTSTEPPKPTPYTCTLTTLTYAAEAEIIGGDGKIWRGELVFTRISSLPPALTFEPESAHAIIFPGGGDR